VVLSACPLAKKLNAIKMRRNAPFVIVDACNFGR